MPGEFDQSGAGAGASGDFNMEAAVSEIASGLGFGEDNGASGTDGDPAADPADNSDDHSGVAGATPPAGEADAGSGEGTPGEGGEAGEATAQPAPAPSPTVDVNQPPKTWRKEAAAAWDSLPPDVKAEIHKREQDMYSGIEQYRDGANFGWQVASLFKPYEQIMQQFGIGPQQILPGLVEAHGTLSLGTEDQKLTLLNRLIKDYAIPVPKLLSRLTDGALGEIEPYVDPEVKALREKLSSVESRLSAQDMQATQQKQQEIRSTVAAFAADPANIYFEELADDIAGLIRGGVTKDIKVAYEKALWANPVVRAKEQARIAAAAESERTRKAAEAAAKAKKAMSANVRSTARNGSPTAPKGQSIDETLEQTLAAIQARSQ